MRALRSSSPIVILVALLLAFPSLFAQDSSQALLVFFRPKRFTGGGLTPSVYVDGQQVARLDNGRFFSLPVDPGRHEVESSMKHSALPVEVRPGETAYLEMVILMGTWRGGGRIIPAPAEEARTAIKKLKPLDKKWILDQKVVFDVQNSSPPTEEQKMLGGEGENVAEEQPQRDCLVEIDSNPKGADVELDGKFVGNTPTKLRLPPGNYRLAVRKTGYDSWERDFTALAGNVLRVSAELEKKE